MTIAYVGIQHEGATHIATTTQRIQTCLSRRCADAAQTLRIHRNAERMRQRPCQFQRLVETTFAQSIWMQRNRNQQLRTAR